MIRSDQFLISVPVQRAEPGMREYGSASVNHQGIIPWEPYGVLSRMPTGRQPRSSTDRRLPCSSVAFPRKRFVHPFTSGLCGRPPGRQAGRRPDRYDPVHHICNVSAETACAPFHKPFPRKRPAHAAHSAWAGRISASSEAVGHADVLRLTRGHRAVQGVVSP
jgi:hypothetical protein